MRIGVANDLRRARIADTGSRRPTLGGSSLVGTRRLHAPIGRDPDYSGLILTAALAEQGVASIAVRGDQMCCDLTPELNCKAINKRAAGGHRLNSVL